MVIDTNKVAFLEMTELSRQIAGRQISSVAVTTNILERIEQINPTLNAYVQVLHENAMKQAERVDREIAEGLNRGPLHGIPIAIKDLCWIAGVPTAAGTTLFRDFVPTRNSTVVQRLEDAGAVLIGKTQLTEGAYSDYHPSIIPVQNPWNSAYWTGISSSGSAVATAAGLCFGSIASDTGGSIRWPASANGVTGIKPTWGRVSRYGVFELAASMDHIGPMARSVADAAAILKAIAGHDVLDPMTSLTKIPGYIAAVTANVRGFRIGIDRQWNTEGTEPEITSVIDEALSVFEKMDVDIVDVAFPDVRQIVDDWAPICAVEAAVAYGDIFATESEKFGPIFADVIKTGLALPGTAYETLLRRRSIFTRRVEALFSNVDAIITPVQPFAPITLERISTLGRQPKLIAMLQRYTCPFDMSGHPTITLPAGFSADHMPIGIQLVSAHFNEACLISLGAAFQRSTAWHKHHPIISEGYNGQDH